MKKSKLYKQITSGKTTLEELFENDTVILHNDKKTVEYVHFWNWSEDVKKTHPNFSDYEIRALTFNGAIVCAGRVISEEEKYSGGIRWFYSSKEENQLYRELMKRFEDK